jgi:predicted NAD/FAD-dependent oxidoreductase
MLALAGKHPLVLSGDYLNAPARIEGAFDSGVAAATYILERV